MLVVYKFPIYTGPFELMLPEFALVVHLATQYGAPQMWVLHDPDAPKIPRKFVRVGTGHHIHAEMRNIRHCGSWLEANDQLVWHLFEVLP